MKTLVEKLHESIILEGSDDTVFTYRNQMDFVKYYKKRAKDNKYKMLLKGRLSFMDRPWAIDNEVVYDAFSDKGGLILKTKDNLTYNEAYNKIVDYYKTNYPEWF